MLLRGNQAGKLRALLVTLDFQGGFYLNWGTIPGSIWTFSSGPVR